MVSSSKLSEKNDITRGTLGHSSKRGNVTGRSCSQIKEHVCFCVLKVFIKRFIFYLFFYFKLIFFYFLNHFDRLVLKIIF
jgi:hypothetical protein